MKPHVGCEYDHITAPMSLLQFCFLPLVFMWIFRRISCSHKWHEKDTDYVLFDGNRTGRYGVLVEINRSGDARYVCRGSSSRVHENFPHYVCGRLEFVSTVVRNYSRIHYLLSCTRHEEWTEVIYFYRLCTLSRMQLKRFIKGLIDCTMSSLPNITPLKIRKFCFPDTNQILSITTDVW